MFLLWCFFSLCLVKEVKFVIVNNINEYKDNESVFAIHDNIIMDKVSNTHHATQVGFTDKFASCE